MQRRRNDSPSRRRLRFEEFEKRLVMSAQAIGSLLPELDIAAPAITQQQVTLEYAAAEAAQVSSQYGFDGAGQTIAVIDSGIAWDHVALGGGYGAGHKVVGGWDFAENDANPYDDGPAGFHGTHVSGIIGSTDAQYRGISPGADLVALRVFSDSGEGKLAWVEQALQWVHEHKDDFENPITTVNLSLGTHWNSDSVPQWVTLEDEFAQLKADGLFISVAAGNAFQTFGEPGLSYPAVSPHVVPVASHGADGNLSDFSQRNEGVLVAPGEMLQSTVPDHLFGGTMSGQFLGASGTSMAAPYVAGASAVLRQANAFMGINDITQEMLYQQFHDSAQQIYDAVTGQYYDRINLEAALASVVTDLHSGFAETATEMGRLTGGETIQGTIGKFSDVDAFTFTADRTGQVTLRFETTHDLTPLVDMNGLDAGGSADEVTLEVVAGEQYHFSVGSNSGNGHYRIDVDFQPSADGPLSGLKVVDWGTTVSAEFMNQTVDGQAAFRVTAARDGLLTIEANFERAGNSPLSIEIYDEQMNLVHSGSSPDGSIRWDVEAHVGEFFIIKATGQSETVDFRVTNLVSVDSGVLRVHGTNHNDHFSVSAKENFSIIVNDVAYQFDGGEVQHVTILGHAGTDSIQLELGDANDHVITRVGGVSVSNHDFRLTAYRFGTVTVDGGGGYNTANLLDTSANDHFELSPREGAMATATYSVSVSSFSRINAISRWGTDSVSMQDSLGADVFNYRDNYGVLTGAGYTLLAKGFERIDVLSIGGSDFAQLFDTTGNDRFYANYATANLLSQQLSVRLADFERINMVAINGGYDRAFMQGTSGTDVVLADLQSSRLTLSDGQTRRVVGFDETQLNVREGDDLAFLTGSEGNDRLAANYAQIEFETLAQSLTVANVERTHFSGMGGVDDVVFSEFETLDLLASLGNTATAYLRDHSIRAEQFETLEARAVDDAIAEYDLDAVDFLYRLQGRWTRKQ